MTREDLYVKCNNYYEYGDLMGYLETLDFEWECGDKPTKWNVYSACKINAHLSVIIVIHLISKIISYAYCTTVSLGEYIFTVEDIKHSLKDYLNKLNKKSFEDLKCIDLKCIDCPFHHFKSCSIIYNVDKTFGELKKEVDQTFEKAKEAYEKGDK